MLQRGLCKSIRSIAWSNDEHKPETRGRSSTSNFVATGSRQNRSWVRFTELQRGAKSYARAYGDLRTKICERTFFLRVRVKEARTLAGQKVRTNRPFATYWTSIDRARNVPILASRPSSSPLDFLGSRQFCVSRLQKIEISFLEFFTRRVLAF